MLSTMKSRRSIRKYKNIPVPKSMLEEIIQAGILAPSARNRQPWKFVIAAGNAKREALEAMEKGMEREQREPFLKETAQFLSGAEHTLEIMKQAPAVIFIVNTEAMDLQSPMSTQNRVDDICNTQSIGAAIENMALMATELGLGSLWICNTFYAYKELCDWLDCEGELYAAMLVGYSDEEPETRPRKSIDDVTEWRM